MEILDYVVQITVLVWEKDSESIKKATSIAACYSDVQRMMQSHILIVIGLGKNLVKPIGKEKSKNISNIKNKNWLFLSIT
ncbi:MAG: hypothetical protein QXX08_07270 [Candidatus Bathyarchaeia archaeon]